MSNQRLEWTAFICETGQADRYLQAGGNVAYRESITVDEEQLDDFLERLGKAKADARLLIRLYFLLQPRVRRFFRQTLPALLRSASHVTTGIVQLSRRGIRGKILWPTTLQARLTGRAPKGSYVVRRPERSPDVPENQLLARFLTDVVDTISEIVLLVGSGAVLVELDDMLHRAQVALNSTYLREVTVPRRATSLMRQRARRHRSPRYKRLAALQRQFESSVMEDRWQSVLRLLQKGWLEPISDDDLFELYALVLILVVLEHDLGLGAPKPGLIRKGRKQVATFNPPSMGVCVEVYFDQSPATHLGYSSAYTGILNVYQGIQGSSHRPDIIVRISFAGDVVRTILFEAKNTEAGDYKRASVYKALAYLKDFEDVWEVDPGQRPKAVLIFPVIAAVAPKSDETGLEVLLAVATRERLKTILTRATMPPT